jgi:cytochrome c2
MRAVWAFICALSLLTVAEIGSPRAQDALSEELLAAADQGHGQRVFTQKCGACHTLMEGGGNLMGPNLGKLFERAAGTREGFDFSDAFEAADFTWTPDRLAEWMRDPEDFLPGNTMLLPEVVSEEDILPLIAYVAVRTGSATWDVAEVESPQTINMGEFEIALKEARPDFWHHLMDNTAHYQIDREDKDYTFVTYFNEDGSITANNDRIKGFWRVESMKSFCYALHGLPVEPYEWVECFPIVPNSIERYGEGLWISEPLPGLKVRGGFLQGRPYPLVGDAHPGYWENLYANTMRYEIDMGNGKIEVVDMYFNKDKSITDGRGTVNGTWWVEGQEGQKQDMCYAINGIKGINVELTQCFALAAMYDPRIGARWPSKFKEGFPYWAEVVEGRD